jgi:Uma2 family endonuclease
MATTTELPTRTFAELHARLGGVPLTRIRTQPPPGTATEDDLLRPHGPTCELIDGVLVEKAMGARESVLGMYIGRLLGEHVEAEDLGLVLGEAGFLRLTGGQIRAPDVTFVPWSEFPGGEAPEDEAFWSVAPVLAVEVLSPTNTRAEIDRKLSELFAAGCKLAWVIDPATKTAKVYTSAKKFKEFDATGTLEGGKVLPGFKLSLADLFAATKRKKKKPR